MFYPIIIHQIVEPDDTYFLAYHPDFGHSSCSAPGATIAEAISNLNDVRENVIEVYNEEGIPVPEPSTMDGKMILWGNSWKETKVRSI